MAKPAKDLTTGDPLRLLAAFVLPMLIGDIVQQLYSMADSVIIGRFVGKAQFAALGATMPVLSVMIVVIIEVIAVIIGSVINVINVINVIGILMIIVFILRLFFAFQDLSA